MPPGPRCVLRTSSFDHPASCVPDVVAARPFLHSVTLVVPAGADADAADPPVRRLPPAPPYFAATAPLTSLVAPSFIEWAVPVRGQPSAVALTTPASLDGGGVAALAPDGVLRLALPGPAWRRLGLGGVRDPGGGDAYTVAVHLASRRAERDAARWRPREGGGGGATPAACGGAASARAALERAGAEAVGVAVLPPPPRRGGAAPPAPPPLPGVRAVAQAHTVDVVTAPSSFDFVGAFGMGGGGGGGGGGAAAPPLDHAAARAALEWLAAAAGRLTGPALASGDAPPLTLTVERVTGFLPASAAVAAVAAARAALAAAPASTPPPWAAVVGVPFPDAPLPDGPAAGAGVDRGAAWAVVAVGGGGGEYALVAAGGGGEGGP